MKSAIAIGDFVVFSNDVLGKIYEVISINEGKADLLQKVPDQPNRIVKDIRVDSIFKIRSEVVNQIIDNSNLLHMEEEQDDDSD